MIFNWPVNNCNNLYYDWKHTQKSVCSCLYSLNKVSTMRMLLNHINAPFTSQNNNLFSCCLFVYIDTYFSFIYLYFSPKKKRKRMKFLIRSECNSHYRYGAWSPILSQIFWLLGFIHYQISSNHSFIKIFCYYFSRLNSKSIQLSIEKLF